MRIKLILFILLTVTFSFVAGFFFSRLVEREVWCFDPVWESSDTVGVTIAKCESNVEVHWID